ncbi:MAG: CYTH domain-containing protein [Kiritimatiellae bacterium]|nr:CYTH domain-containing protein [Kiritimatiellia bacterium]
MALEIERKFLVNTAIWRRPEGGVRMRQGYVATKDGTTVRVRIAGERAYLTLKDHAVVITRHEFEYEIPLSDAETLLDTMCVKPQIDKVRYRIPAAEPGLFWEVDEFLGDNASLVTAEIELPSEDTPFTKPIWLGADVTDDHRYKNNNLANAPYSTWGAGEGRQRSM